jgi:hypothetical protein
MRAETELEETEGAVVARERPIDTFPRQRTRDATIEELLAFSVSYRCSMKQVNVGMISFAKPVLI